MTLNTRQTKVVDGAKDLLRRLKNERQRKVRPPNQEAKVAREFSREGSKLIRRLLTVINQLDKAGEANRRLNGTAEQEKASLVRERDRLHRQLSTARTEMDQLGPQVASTAWLDIAGWLREQAAVEFIEGNDDKAAQTFRRAYRMVKRRAQKCQRQAAPKSPNGEELYVLSMATDQKLTGDQTLRVQSFLVDIGHGELIDPLLGRGRQAAVEYVLGVQIQNFLGVEMGLEGTKLQRCS